MRGVPRRRKACESQDLVGDDVDVLLGDGHELAPERFERVAVEPACARLEAGRVGEVRGADRRDVHLNVRVLPHDRARRAGVVEVDVREEQMLHIGQLDTALG